MTRRAHRLGHNKGCEQPVRVVCFDTETREEVVDHETKRHVLTFGWLTYHRRHRRGAWAAPAWTRFTRVGEFWDCIEALTPDRTRLDLYCHNAAFDGQVLDAINELERRGWKLHLAVLEGPPTIVTWRKGSRTIRLLDTLNIWRLPLKEIGKHVGLEKLDFLGVGVVGEEADTYCRRDVEILWKALSTWWAFIQANDLGTCMATLASQAFTAYRHRFMSVEIYCDSNEQALAIARAAYRGGRCEAQLIGRTDWPVHVFDVNSMYMYAMHGLEVPVKLITVTARKPVEQVAEWLTKYAICAEVVLDTPSPIYPKDYEGRLCFPIGRFTTTLAGPELHHAIHNGHVHAITKTAVYERAEAFTAFIDWCWTARAQALREGREVDAWMYKHVGTNFYGKFGQRGRVWEFNGAVLPGVTADLSSYDLETGKWVRLRVVGGQVQLLNDEGESFNSMPAIAAYITSAARLHLYKLVCLAGWERVHYLDTDSLWVAPTAVPMLTPLVDPQRLGALKLERVEPWVRFRGPKDYETPSLRKTKGVRRDAIQIAPGVWQQTHWTGWKGALAQGDTSAPRTHSVVKSRAPGYKKGSVDASGWVSPFTLREW